jgi:hypothetical protein
MPRGEQQELLLFGIRNGVLLDAASNISACLYHASCIIVLYCTVYSLGDLLLLVM